MTITNSYTRFVAVAAGAVLALGLLFGAVGGPARAASLTTAQIQSIVGLLQSFGADQTTINNVQAALSGEATPGTTPTGTGTGGSCPALSRSLQEGSTGADVMALQKFLNATAATQVATTGAGSPGLESMYFGPATKAAVEKFQTLNNVSPIGIVGPQTRAAIAAVCSTGTVTPPTGGTTPPVAGSGGTAVVSAAAQPPNTVAPINAARVPFTAFTVTAQGGDVVLNSVAVQRQGPSQDTDIASVVLINAATGVQIGNSRILDSNHSAVIGSPITIPSGTSMTFWVSGNISATAGSGDIASFAVTALNTNGTVSGSLPITGASNTFNSNLVIGSATVQTSSFDPNSGTTDPIGTTGYRFSGIRIQAGSVEDTTFKSITWYEEGSASGLQNVVTVVNGTSYPTTVDATGRYYTAVFPGGIVIPKGQSVDVYIQGDLGANATAGTVAEFDIYRNTDIYLTGNTYGFGITPTIGSLGVISSAATHGSNFAASQTGNPFFQGSTLSVTAGTFSTIQNATGVGAQNIAINVANQMLGGFQTNLTGEAIQVQTLVVHFTTSADLAPMTNISLVNQTTGNTVAGPFNAKCAVSSTDTTGITTTLGTPCADPYQFVTFSGATNFPTGSAVYVVEGQVASQTGINGTTIQASTNPSSSSDWGNVTGNTTGNTITPNVFLFTMSTMTVKAATLNVANATTPTSQVVVRGGSNINFANVQLDASQSGENVRLSSMPMSVVLGGTGTPSTADLGTCQLWAPTGSTVNGAVVSAPTALNTGTRVINSSNISATPAGAGTYAVPFNFDNSFTVKAGTVVTLSLDCSLASNANANATYQWSAASTGYSVTGAISGSTVTPTIASGSGPTMTASTGATLAVTSGDQGSGSPALAIAAGGTTGVLGNVIKFHATNEGVNLQKVGLVMTNASTTANANAATGTFASSTPADIVTAYLYANNNILTTSGAPVSAGTLLGTATFTGNSTTATSTLLNNGIQLPNNTDASIAVKFDLASIGINQPGAEGNLIQLDYLNSQGTGALSGTTVYGATQTGSVQGVRVYRTYPQIAAGPTLASNPQGLSQKLKEFTVTANGAGQVGLYQISFNIATSSASVQNLQLNAYTDSGYSSPASVPGTSGGQFGTAQCATGVGCSAAQVAGTAPVVFTQSVTPFEISAGQTIYFTLYGDVSLVGTPTAWSVSAKLLGDSSYPSMSNQGVTYVPGPSFPLMRQATVVSPSSFVWSPNATGTSALTTNDWTNSYTIPGLSSNGF